MTGHQPIPETCGCFLVGGQMFLPDTCQACAGSMRQLVLYSISIHHNPGLVADDA